jgi:hypothetical protein
LPTRSLTAPPPTPTPPVGGPAVRHPSGDLHTTPLPPGGDYKAVLDPSLACMAEQEHRERSEAAAAAAAEPAGPSFTEPIQASVTMLPPYLNTLLQHWTAWCLPTLLFGHPNLLRRFCALAGGQCDVTGCPPLSLRAGKPRSEPCWLHILPAGHHAGPGQRLRDPAPAAPRLTCIGCHHLHLSSARCGRQP